jgi:PAS domain S-box-containing protein
MENRASAVSNKNFDKMLIDCSIDAIIAIDCNYTVIAWNQAAAFMYNVPKKQALGRSLFKLIASLEEDTETVTAIDSALKGHKTFVPASKLYAHRKHSENHYIPLCDNDGNVCGVMNIVHDVAHRIKAERELQRLNEELKKQYRQLKATADELASFTFITSNKIKEPYKKHLYKCRTFNKSGSGPFNR